MEDAMRLAGFFAAHAIWCVAGGETLVPMLAHTNGSGERIMTRLLHDRLEDAVAAGKKQLDLQPAQAPNAVLLYDAYITLADGRTDAIVIEARVYEPDEKRLVIAVPYRKGRRWFSQFKVYKPKFLECSEAETDWQTLGGAFFDGVASHKQGSAIWNARIDQSK